MDKNVCICPAGVVDFECATQVYQKCYVNITDPPFYQGCEDRPDSFQYLYSVPGFSPCYPQYFNESISIKYHLVCQSIDGNGFAAVPKEQNGYPYRDIVKEATFNPYTYVSNDPESEFNLIEDNQVQI